MSLTSGTYLQCHSPIGLFHWFTDYSPILIGLSLFILIQYMMRFEYWTVQTTANFACKCTSASSVLIWFCFDFDKLVWAECWGTLCQTHNTLEGLLIPSGLKAPQDPPSEAGRCSWSCVVLLPTQLRGLMSSQHRAERLPSSTKGFCECTCACVAEWSCLRVQELRHKCRCTAQPLQILKLLHFLSTFYESYISAKSCYVTFIIPFWQLLLNNLQLNSTPLSLSHSHTNTHTHTQFYDSQ